MKRSPADDFAPDAQGRRSQFGALCWRWRAGRVQVMLVTSRDTGRWVIPKGWPMTGLDGAATAEREAWEEAGARGVTGPHPLGWYGYDKVLRRGRRAETVPCLVAVHPLRVTAQAEDFPEARQRTRAWFDQDDAARRVEEAELSQIIAAFRPPGAQVGGG